MGRLKAVKKALDQAKARRISQRFPTAVAATEDALTEDLVIDVEAMRTQGKSFEKNAALVASYNTTRTGAKRSKAQADAFLREAKDNLLSIYNNVPKEIRDVSKNWYIGANKISREMAEKYGVSNEAAGGVLAALSPQKDWYQNASLADRVISIHSKAKQGGLVADDDHGSTMARLYSKPAFKKDVEAAQTLPYNELTTNQKSIWVRSFDQTFNDRSYDIISPEGESVGKALTTKGEPGTAAWGSNVEIGKAISVLEDPSIENISKSMGDQHKVRNFYNNIVDPMHAKENPEIADVTIDTHAVAAGLLKPLSGNSPEVTHNFGGTGSASSSITGAQGTYGLHADAYRQAAADVGIMPREMQSVTWEAIRGLFPRTFKGQHTNVNDINGIWDLYNQGKLSKDQARSLVIERAGGMDEPDWFVRPNPGDALRATGVGDEGGLRSSSLPRTSGVDSRAGLISAGVPAAWLGLSAEDAQALTTSAATQDLNDGFLGAAALGSSILGDTIGSLSELGGLLNPFETIEGAQENAGILADNVTFIPKKENRFLNTVSDGVDAIGEAVSPFLPDLPSEESFDQSIPGQAYDALPERLKAILKTSAGIAF